MVETPTHNIEEDQLMRENPELQVQPKQVEVFPEINQRSSRTTNMDRTLFIHSMEPQAQIGSVNMFGDLDIDHLV